MSVKEIAKNKYQVSFVKGYNNEIKVGQNETGRILNFLITDENSQSVDTTNFSLEMIIVTRWGKEKLSGVRQPDGTFNINLTQKALQYWDLNAKYQLYLTDTSGTVLTRSGDIEIFKDLRIDDKDDVNLALDFEDIKRTMLQLEEYVERGEENFNNVIAAKDEVLIIKDDADVIKTEILKATDGIKEQAEEIRESAAAILDVKDKITNIDETATYLKDNAEAIESNVLSVKNNADKAETSAAEAIKSKDEVIRIESELGGTLDKETDRQQAESIRKSNEEGRVLQETNRKIEEEKRVLAENSRNISETARNGNEDLRISEERNRVTSENNRINSEENRSENFKTWALEFQKFIENDKNNILSETQRKEEWLKLKTELETLMEQLSEFDAADLQIQLNKLETETKGYIKSAQINSISNSIELFTGNDITEPTFIIALPKGFSGDYNDLSNKPKLFDGDYEKLTNKPVLFSKDYNDLINKPEIFSGNYADLKGTPVLFSGSYNDLTEKPTLFSGKYIDLKEKPEVYTKSEIDNQYQDLFQSVSNGKGLLASAITDKGVSTSETDTFVTMGENISKITTAELPVGSYLLSKEDDENLTSAIRSIIDVTNRISSQTNVEPLSEPVFDKNVTIRYRDHVNNVNSKLNIISSVVSDMSIQSKLFNQLMLIIQNEPELFTEEEMEYIMNEAENPYVGFAKVVEDILRARVI